MTMTAQQAVHHSSFTILQGAIDPRHGRMIAEMTPVERRAALRLLLAIGLYAPVAQVNVMGAPGHNTIESAYAAMEGFGDGTAAVKQIAPCYRSMIVGDLAIDDASGAVLLCAPTGWLPVASHLAEVLGAGEAGDAAYLSLRMRRPAWLIPAVRAMRAGTGMRLGVAKMAVETMAEAPLRLTRAQASGFLVQAVAHIASRRQEEIDNGVLDGSAGSLGRIVAGLTVAPL